jgi:hypothetical protein
VLERFRPTRVTRPTHPTRAALAAALALAALAPATAVAASSDGVHPGAIVNSDVGQCTDNFLFLGSDGNRYIGSAGHCILGTAAVGGGDAGEKTWAPGKGPVANDSSGKRIGEFAYAILQDPKDFSLIRLDPSVPASPQMPVYGGPTGIFTDTSSNPVLLQYFGEGIVVSDVAPARNAVAIGAPDPDHLYAQGIVVPGDSGSAIESSDGSAVGVIVTTGVHTGSIGSGGVDAGLMGITRLPPQLARASQTMGIALTLQTAPLLNGCSTCVVPATTGSSPSHTSGTANSSSSRPTGAHSSRPHSTGKSGKKKHKKHAHRAHRKAKHGSHHAKRRAR